jgi:hypothetical protein
MLCGQAPVESDLRRKLPFKNGMVYDFEKKTAYKAHRGLVATRIVPWDYATWKAPAAVRANFTSVVRDMVQWEHNGGGDLLPVPPTRDAIVDDARDPGNPELAALFTAVMEKIEGVSFLNKWFNADGVAYFLKHYARMMSAEPKVCEMLNIHGPPRSGKDALAALFESHMGNVDENGFAGGLMPEQVQVRKSTTTVRGGNGPTPFLDAPKGARSGSSPS